MNTYFPGTKVYGPFELTDDKRNSIAYSITEKWVSDRSHTVRCGVSDGFGVSITVGISVSELDALKSSIEGSFGLGIASIKTNIETNTQITTTFSESETETDTFACPAPTCGRYTYFLYQLVRDYRFVFTDLLLRKWVILT